MRVKWVTAWAMPLVIVLGAQTAAQAQHVAAPFAPVETHGWGPESCSSCSTGGSFFSGSFFSGWFGSRFACHEKCQRFFCCPPYKHCAEGPPRIRFRQGCPKPICTPCDNQFWGYYQTCWTPWPWPANWSHCPVPPPASQVVPPHTWASEYLDHVNRLQNGGPPPSTVRPPMPQTAPGGQLPMPRKIQ